MEIARILEEATRICIRDGVTRLVLAGSFAKGTNHPKSDIDLAVDGDFDYFTLVEDLDAIETVRPFDVIDLRTLRNTALQEDIRRYGKILYQAV